MKFIPGLVSVTFRQLDPAQIVTLVAQAGLKAIEWGGDIHAPSADLKKVSEAARLSREAGLETPVYGSYYVLEKNSLDDFRRTLEAAQTLGASMIRIWAGQRPLQEFDEALIARTVECARQAGDLAQKAGVTLVTEWHSHTLLETTESALRFFKEVNHPAVQNFWQPNVNCTPEERLCNMDAALPRLRGLHVFSWGGASGYDRFGLEEGRKEWLLYLKKAATVNRPLYAMLEFVKSDAPEQFLKDAETLKTWIKETV